MDQWALIHHRFVTCFVISLNLNIEKKMISNSSSNAYEYHGIFKFIDELCAINNDHKFLTSVKNINFKELYLTVEHHGNHVSFLDLDIKIEDSFRI